MNLLVIALSVLLVPLSLSSQDMSGTIAGVVVKVGAREPLAGVRVELSEAGRSRRFETMTTASGQFQFPKVPAGSYRLLATGSGYMATEYSKPLLIAAETVIRNIQLEMVPWATISGQVRDEYAEPLGAATVEALQLVYRDGRRQMITARRVLSDDRGQYRLSRLPPGKYYIGMIPPGEQDLIKLIQSGRSQLYLADADRQKTQVYVPTYFPGVSDLSEASVVEIHAGQNLNGIGIMGRSARTSRHVSGKIIDSTTRQPVSFGELVVTTQDSKETVVARMSAPGYFDLLLPSGYYWFTGSAKTEAMAGGTIPGPLFARIPITVGNANIENLNLTLTGTRISGRILSEEGISMELIRPWIRLRSDIVDSGYGANPDINGSFLLPALSPGQYRWTVHAQGGSYVKSVYFGARDISNSGLFSMEADSQGPLTFVLAADGGSIDGFVENTSQRPVPGAIVVLLPETSKRGRTDLYKTAYADSNGRFHMSSVAPGQYKAFAWEAVENGAWEDNEFISLYEPFGVSVRVGERANITLRLTILRNRDFPLVTNDRVPDSER